MKNNSKVLRSLLALLLVFSILATDVYVLADSLKNLEEETLESKEANIEDIMDKDDDSNKEEQEIEKEEKEKENTIDADYKLRAIDIDSKKVIKEVALKPEVAVVEAIEIEGYTLNDFETKEVFLEEEKTVDFYYKKNPKESNLVSVLVIKHKDSEGNEIVKPDVLHVLKGSYLKLEGRDIRGYQKETGKKAISVYGDTEVTFNYKGNSTGIGILPQPGGNHLSEEEQEPEEKGKTYVILKNIDDPNNPEILTELELDMINTSRAHGVWLPFNVGGHYYAGEKLLHEYSQYDEETLIVEYKTLDKSIMSELGHYTVNHGKMAGIFAEEVLVGSKVKTAPVERETDLNIDIGNQSYEFDITKPDSGEMLEIYYNRLDEVDSQYIGIKEKDYGRYTVKMVLEGTDQEIAPSFYLRGNVNNKIKLPAPEVEGYNITKDKHKEFTIKDVNNDEVVFEYKKDVVETSITLRGLDEEGNKIYEEKREELDGENIIVGKEYSVEALSKQGYILDDYETKSIVTKENEEENVVEFRYITEPKSGEYGYYKVRHVEDIDGVKKDLIRPRTYKERHGVKVKVYPKKLDGYNWIQEGENKWKEVKVDHFKPKEVVLKYEKDGTGGTPEEPSDDKVSYTVEHLDITNNEVLESHEGEGPVGSVIVESYIKKEGYELLSGEKEIQELKLSKDKSKNKIVFRYVEKLDPQEGKGGYLVKHIDSKTGENLIEPRYYIADSGVSITLESREFNDYEALEPTSQTITIKNGKIEKVIFKYEAKVDKPEKPTEPKDKMVKYTIDHIDVSTDSGDKLIKSYSGEGEVGSTIKASVDMSIINKGYSSISKTPQELILTEDEESNKIVFKYTKEVTDGYGAYIVRHVDENDQDIIEPIYIEEVAGRTVTVHASDLGSKYKPIGNKSQEIVIKKGEIEEVIFRYEEIDKDGEVEEPKKVDYRVYYKSGNKDVAKSYVGKALPKTRVELTALEQSELYESHYELESQSPYILEVEEGKTNEHTFLYKDLSKIKDGMGSYVIRHVDKNDNDITDRIVMEAPVGDKITVEPTNLGDGYKAISKEAQTVEIKKDETKYITFEYEVIDGSKTPELPIKEEYTVDYIFVDNMTNLYPSNTGEAVVGSTIEVKAKISKVDYMVVGSLIEEIMIEEGKDNKHTFEYTKASDGVNTKYIVRHIDDATGEDLVSPQIYDGIVGDTVVLYAENFGEGYEVVGENVRTIELKETQNEVVFRYKVDDDSETPEVPKSGEYTISYTDYDKGNVIADQTKGRAPVGTIVYPKAKDIGGYVRVTKSPQKIKIAEETKFITYRYRSEGLISKGEAMYVVNHVDERGHDIISPTAALGNVGDKITVFSKEFDGYKLKDMESNYKIIKLEEEDLYEVTFEYEFTGSGDRPEIKDENLLTSYKVRYKTEDDKKLQPEHEGEAIAGSRITLEAERKIDKYHLITRNPYQLYVNNDKSENIVTFRYKAEADKGKGLGMYRVRHINKSNEDLIDPMFFIDKAGRELTIRPSVSSIENYRLDSATEVKITIKEDEIIEVEFEYEYVGDDEEIEDPEQPDTEDLMGEYLLEYKEGQSNVDILPIERFKAPINSIVNLKVDAKIKLGENNRIYRLYDPKPNGEDDYYEEELEIKEASTKRTFRYNVQKQRVYFDYINVDNGAAFHNTHVDLPVGENYYHIGKFEGYVLTEKNIKKIDVVEGQNPTIKLKYKPVLNEEFRSTVVIRHVFRKIGQEDMYVDIIDPEIMTGLTNSLVEGEAKEIPGYNYIGINDKKTTPLIKGRLGEIIFIYESKEDSDSIPANAAQGLISLPELAKKNNQ